MPDEASPPPTRRALSPRRRRLFALLALPVLWLLLEGLAAIALVGLSPLESDHEWLTENRAGRRFGFYVPDPHCIWLPRPGLAAPRAIPVWGSKPLRINDNGHRSAEMTREKPAGVRRILLVGGSHPFGMWVDREETYLEVLGRLLAERGEGRWEVLNAASPGHTTHQGLRYLEHHAAQFEPDIVLFDLGINDNLPLSTSWSRPDHEVEAVPPGVSRAVAFVETSRVYQLLKLGLASARETDEDVGVRVPKERRRANLRAAGDLAKESGYGLLYMSQVAVFREPDGKGASHCVFRARGFEPRADVCGRFEDLGRDAASYFVDPVHATAEGHDLIARTVLRRLDELGWTQSDGTEER